MNHHTSRHPLPSLVAHVLTDTTHYIDNLFASARKSLHLNRRLQDAGFAKRSGFALTETVFVLMVWKWLNVSSIAMFCRNALSVFSRAKKDVLYDFLKREDIHWRKFNLHTAREVYRQHGLVHSPVKAFVLDDSIKTRRGKKMEDVSSHYDHTTNRHVMGQQVLTLGLVSDEAFLPLDSQVYVSSKKAQALNRPYEDRRSIAAQRYREATTRTKPQMALAMMKRAVRNGVEADYLVADAWFGTKTMMRAADEVGVCAVLRMKKGLMKYRVPAGKEAKQHLGFLAEQTRTFASHTASIHLCAIRYLMLVHAKLDGEGAGVSGIRADIRDQLNLMSFAVRLWQIFRAIISGTLDELGDILGCSAECLMRAFDEKVNQFFTQSLQLDVYTMRLEHE